MFRRFSELKSHHQLLYGFFIAIAVVGVWRGIWGLMDVFLFPGNPLASYSLSLGVGLIILTLTHYHLWK